MGEHLSTSATIGIIISCVLIGAVLAYLAYNILDDKVTACFALIFFAFFAIIIVYYNLNNTDYVNYQQEYISNDYTLKQSTENDSSNAANSTTKTEDTSASENIEEDKTIVNFCPSCGTRVDGANYCSNCGTKL